ncbi:anti-sigma factor domain-containing protein [Neobacillus thermocopriae]|uniref:Anti-sigma factor domain-containing protein n=1 Tax=Neobacillus thermocopriae TaxID=1215031 RepID=A0A6B3TTH7_9BACI|nr:anti-sigma factor domain-containing protein [Neobacillus thermocopriae]MED3623175.1 anti-sigma factor domain-containing protein [Neobacillus thermocopriae]MED3715070.1 anti-sigma factor domain-containing protein [Neobacillus thermocopriae]NEX79758.1 anti-sigma factor domain-containing protein [Neobacillus thermocopriae]
MKKGIVMEMDESFLTLLTPEGEFYRARRQEQTYEIGEEIYFTPIQTKKRMSLFFPFKKMTNKSASWIAVAAGLIVIFVALFSDFQSKQAYAYMSIDVNPSIEIGVNERMQVVELTGYNQDGKEIISQLDHWVKKDVSELIKDILKAMKKQGYLANSSEVIISAVRTNELKEEVERKLKKNMDEIKSEITKHNLDTIVVSGTKKDLEKAHKMGITTGKYQTEAVKESKERKKKNTEVNKQKSNKSYEHRNESNPNGKSKKQSTEMNNIPKKAAEDRIISNIGDNRSGKRNPSEKEKKNNYTTNIQNTFQAKKESILIKKESIQKKEESIQTRKESIQNKREPIQKKKESIQNRRESIQTKKESIQNKRESIQTRRESIIQMRKESQMRTKSYHNPNRNNSSNHNWKNSNSNSNKRWQNHSNKGNSSWKNNRPAHKGKN